MYEDQIPRAIAKDIAGNPGTLFALANMESAAATQEFLMADIAREIHGLGGPVAFPRLRFLVRDAIRQAKELQSMGVRIVRSGMGIVMGSPALDASLFQLSTKAAVEEVAKEEGFNTGKFIGDLVGTLAGAAASIYTTRQTLKAQENALKQQSAIAAANAEAQAAAMRAAQAQQAVMVRPAVAAPGLPGWVLPVAGVAATGLFLIFVLPKIIGG